MKLHNPSITGSLTLSGSTTFSAGTIEFTGANQKISGSATSTGSFGRLFVGGTSQFNNTITIGASSNMTWDTSEDDLVLNDSRIFIDQDDDAEAFVIDSEQTSDWAAKINGKYGLNIIWVNQNLFFTCA